jgi:hypothetical protein
VNYPIRFYTHDQTLGDTCGTAQKILTHTLLRLGARASDFRVDACHLGGNQPSVDARFSVLVPADKTDESAATVATRWQFHQWKGELNCLEVAYVAHDVLPLFSTKDVRLFSKADCRRSAVGLRVKMLTLLDSA